MACPDIKPESDPDFILSSYNASAGTQVLIGCKKFGYRLEGPHNVTCFSNQTWSDNLTELECKWTGELNTYEKIVIGTGAGCLGLLILGLLFICCCSYIHNQHLKRRRAASQRSYSQFDPPQKDQAYSNDYIRQSGPYADRISPQDNSSMDGYKRPQGVIDDPSNYHIYTGRKGEMNGKSAYKYDNRAFESQDQGYYDNGHNKDPPYWNGQIPRPQIRDSRNYY
ncbi:uncharacterized protein LOC128173439 isoform X2 [Crassostrea angulata]|uniref:uncharacterized protein isoform X2 n=1 Tax=Magallana gigas TaxID=29159 RepID=UPI0022B0853B|nr:uncharacterized protein LOC128173439 isoform X2 [Crassostrea angulata]